MAARGFADPKTLIENVQSGRGQYIRPYLFENLPNTRKVRADGVFVKGILRRV